MIDIKRNLVLKIENLKDEITSIRKDIESTSQTNYKLIDSLLQHNKLLLIQQERVTTELLTPTSKNSCKSRKKDVIQMENNIRQE